MQQTAPVDRAVAAVGGEDAFLARLQISRRTLYYWRANGIPAVRLARVSQATRLPVQELRPDLMGGTPATEAA